MIYFSAYISRQVESSYASSPYCIRGEILLILGCLRSRSLLQEKLKTTDVKKTCGQEAREFSAGVPVLRVVGELLVLLNPLRLNGV